MGFGLPHVHGVGKAIFGAATAAQKKKKFDGNDAVNSYNYGAAVNNADALKKLGGSKGWMRNVSKAATKGAASASKAAKKSSKKRKGGSGGSGGGGGSVAADLGGAAASGALSTGNSEQLAALTDMLKKFQISTPSDADIKRRAFNEIALQYNPQIRALDSDVKAKKYHAARAKGNIKAIYDDLSAYYKAQIPASQKSTAAFKKDAAARAASLKSEITKSYGSALSNMVNEYKQLGIEAAGATTLPQQSSDQAGYSAQAGMIGRAEQAALNIEQQADTDYWRQGAATTQREATEQTDIDCPANTIYLINEKEIKLYREHDWEWMAEDGSRWKQVHDGQNYYDAWTAMLSSYLAMGTRQRNAHSKIEDVAEA